MPSRYYVRTVNKSTINEHYVVADVLNDSACINVYFNEHAAAKEARWLNRYSRIGIFSGDQLGSASHASTTILDVEGKTFSAKSKSGPAMSTRSPNGTDQKKSKPKPSNRESSTDERAKSMLRRRLVR